MLFSHISILCNALEIENSRLIKKKILHNFFTSHSPSDIKLAINFLSLSIDNNTALFQINEITIIKYIAEYLQSDLRKIKNDIKIIGDIGLFFSHYKKTVDNNNSNISYQEISLQEINELLLDLENSKGKDSQEKKKKKIVLYV